MNSGHFVRGAAIVAGMAGLLTTGCGGEKNTRDESAELYQPGPIQTLTAQPELDGVVARSELRVYNLADLMRPSEYAVRPSGLKYDVSTHFTAQMAIKGCMVVNFWGLQEGKELDPASDPVEGTPLTLGPVCNAQLGNKVLQGSVELLDTVVRVPEVNAVEGTEAAEGTKSETLSVNYSKRPARFIAKLCWLNPDGTESAAPEKPVCNTAYFA